MYFSPILPNVGLPYKFGGFFQFWPPRPQFPLPPHILIIPITQNLGLPIPRILHTQIWDFPPQILQTGLPPPQKSPDLGRPPHNRAGPRGWGCSLTFGFLFFSRFSPPNSQVPLQIPPGRGRQAAAGGPGRAQEPAQRFSLPVGARLVR